MKKIILILFLLPILCQAQLDTSFNQIDTKLKYAALRLKQKVIESKNYIKPNRFNENYVFMIDMSIPSGKKRFFVYNLKTDSIETSSLVAHGFGSDVGSDGIAHKQGGVSHLLLLMCFIKHTIHMYYNIFLII